MKKTLAFAPVALALACAAQAAPLTFGFTGTVTAVPVDESNSGIAFGDPFSGQYIFDSAVADAIAGAAQGSYGSIGPGFGMSVQIGSNSYSLAGSLNVGVTNDVLGVDQYTVFASDGTLTLELFLEDSTGAVFASDALPGLPPPLGSFAVRDFHLIDTSLGELQIDGQIDSLTCLEGCVVPEPGTLALLGAGLLAGALRRRLIA